MRVLHVIPSISVQHGGPSQAVRVMAKAAGERGFHVEVAATSAGTPQGEEDSRRVWEFEDYGATFRLFPNVPGTSWHFSLPLARWLFANVRRYDLLHIHAPFSGPSLSACASARRARVPYVYRTLGTLDPWCIRQGYWKKRPYYALLERANLAHAATIHVTSQAEWQALADLGFGDKSAIIPNAIEQPEWGPRERHDGPLRLLFLGRLHPIKGLPLLFRALSSAQARRGSTFVLQIAGDGDAAYRRELQEEIASLGLRDLVRFLGFVGGETKVRALRETDVVVAPGYHENFGIAVVEAMAAGLPAIVSDGVALAPEIHEADAGLVFASGNVELLAAALIEMLDRPYWQRASDNARRFASRFSLEALGNDLERTYRKVASETPWRRAQ